MLQELSRNKKIGTQIMQMLDSERTVHAFLFCGGSKASREEIGLWLAKKVLCKDEASERIFDHGNCLDLILVTKPEDRESILKEQILELNEKLSFKPFGERYAVIIKDADLMNQIAQNKLLKGLEEPISPAVFILLAEREDSLLNTIRSRCSCFSLEEETAPVSEAAEEASEKFVLLIKEGGSYYKKRNVISYILANKEDPRSAALEFLNALEGDLEKGFLSGNRKCAEAMEHTEIAIMYIKQLQSVPYTLKQLCLRV